MPPLDFNIVSEKMIMYDRLTAYENLRLFAKGPLEPALMDAVAQAVPDLPDPVLMPNLWNVKRPAR